MKKIILSLCLLLGLGFGVSAQDSPKPFSIPEVSTWKASTGRFVPAGRIVVKKDKELQRIARLLAEDYRTMFGRTLKVVSGTPRKGDILLGFSSSEKLGTEGYALTVDGVVTLHGATPEGLYWGTRTFLQLSEQSADRSLPCGVAVDKPSYATRGFMIDCGRKFFSIDYLRSLVKVMSYYKMNTLQIHLNDNGFKQYFGGDWNKTQAAFRMESERFPGLTAKDGHYSKKEFGELQDFAASLGVNIIPEIDVPAHCLALTHFRPSLGSKKYGPDHLDLFNPETYTFLDSLFAEYIDGEKPVFRGKQVCIGTDEYSNADKEVVEKFRYFTDYYIKYMERFGKQALIWGSLTHARGTTPVKVDNVPMLAWSNGYADPKEMMDLGYKLVSIPDGYVYIVPAAGYYYDYLNTEWLYNGWTPANVNGVQFEENHPAILGGMFAVWNDHPGNGITEKDVHHRLMPAMQTLSAKMWSAKAVTFDYKTFEKNRTALSEAPGVNELGRIRMTYDEATALQKSAGLSYAAEEGAAGTANAVSATGGTTQVLTGGFGKSTVASASVLPIEEVGYPYEVSFDIEAAKEEKGTVLFRSKNATVYLSDPKTGQLSFEREGYVTRFNYTVPAGQKVSLKFTGDNRQTSLYVNGKRREELAPLTVQANSTMENIDPYMDKTQVPFDLSVSRARNLMYIQRTLVFPLRKAGDFKSKITNLEVEYKGK